MGIFLSQPNCRSFFLWGVNDAQSWVPGVFNGYGSALLFSNTAGAGGEYVPKSCYYGVKDALLTSTAAAQSRTCVLRKVPSEGFLRTYDLLGRRLGPSPSIPHIITAKSGNARN
jgi:hypothetical protein